jgi:nucleotide-binding universal stress UspA family protein
MYKGASQAQQHAAAVNRWQDFAHGEEALTPEQEREAILTAMPALERRIAEAGKDERAALGKRKLELQGRLGELRKKIHERRHKGRPISQFFQEVCKERLPKWQYDMLVRAALDRMDEVQPEEQGK